MNFDNLTYRVLRRLRIQPFLNWNSRLPRPSVRLPLLGGVLGSGAMLYRGSWKSDAFRRLANLRPLGQVLDVGGNEGQTLLDLLEAGMGAVPVATFEPNPVCAYYLRCLIDLNAWRHVELFPLALAADERCLVLELESENSSGATLIEDLRPGRSIATRQVVPCFSLDKLVETQVLRTHPGFVVKIDVEGAELDVVNGGLRTLSRHRPVVLCEVLWAHDEGRRGSMRNRNSELMRSLGSVGYEVLRLALDRAQRSVLGTESISRFPDDVYGEHNAHLCDYVFVPSELRSRIESLFAS